MKKQKRILPAILALLLAMALSVACSSGTGTGTDAQEAAQVVNAGDIVINEIVSSNSRSLTDEQAGSPDWIELHNTTDHAISLKGFGFSDNSRKLYKFTFDAVTIPAGGYQLLYCGEPASVEESSIPFTGFGISKGGDTLYLTDGYYNILTQLDVPSLQTDVSYARRDDGSYGYCGSPTPGAANDTEISDSQESLFTATVSGGLSITEVKPGLDPWMELKNVSGETLQLSNYYVSDKGTDLLRYQLPDVSLAPGAYYVVYLVGADDGASGERTEATFKLGKNDDHLYVADRSGELISEFSWGGEVPEGIAVVAGADGTPLYTAYPTPGADNSDDTFSTITYQEMDASDPVRINEVLRKNEHSITDAQGDRESWVELYNSSSEAVSMSGYYLSDSLNNLQKWAIPDVSIPAGGYLIIFLDGDIESSTDTELHAPFSLAAGESISLLRLDGLRVDTINIPEDLAKNVSVGRDTDGSIRYYTTPTPGYQNAHGFETADSLGCFNSSYVYVSEVCAVHAIKTTENDWVELYNGSSSGVDLSGWYLSDDTSEPLKYQLPEGTGIGAGEYLVIECTSHTSRQKEGVATFGLNPDGETICLSDADGLRVDTFRTGALTLGVTSGRVEGAVEGDRVFFKTETKGKQNSTNIYSGYTATPVFSETDLYQTDAFELTLTCSTASARIYYTTDGSKPTSSSKEYTGPITIKKNMCVRAIAYCDGLLASEIATYNFLFEVPHTLPVVCLNGDPDDIKAVWAAKSNKTKVEREAYISYYEADGKLGTQFPCGIKAKGAGTITYSQKSLAIHLRGGYGQSSVTYPFFGYGDVTTFSSLVLRNSGQDFGDHSTDCRLRDSFASRAAVGLNLDYAMTRPVIVYRNGEYYGIYDFNEDLNKDYLEAHYGVDGDQVDIIKRNTTVLKGSNTDIKRVFAYGMEKDLSNDETFAQYAEWIDVEYFTDYFIAQTYFSNSDMFNQKYWRSQDYTVKWRPIYYDLDFAAANSYTRNILSAYFSETGVPSHDGSLTHMDIYVGLKKNKAWRMYAAERYVQVVLQYYNADRLLGILDELVDEMEPEMERHIKKWGRPKSMSTWKSAVEDLRTWIKRRPEKALEQMQSYFGISDSQMAEWREKYSS